MHKSSSQSHIYTLRPRTPEHPRFLTHFVSLQPENLLLTEDNVLKITDFGLSALMTTDTGAQRMLTTVCGTPQYASPEVCN